MKIISLHQVQHLDESYYGILGRSCVMQDLSELIENVSATEAPVLITGESGTGKELVACAIHEASERRHKPFIKVNCAALNENLLESELFGHAKGSYTGADRARIGRFEAAHGGTIFLDEIGDIPMSTQVKLLRVLEEKEIERVGEHKLINVNVRVVSATNKHLEKLIDTGAFRQDLFFRINVFPIRCPALREHKEDIPVIVQRFIKTNAAKTGKRILGLTPGAMEKLAQFDWPGNVRELRNAIEYAFVLCPGGRIDIPHLPAVVAQDPAECPPPECAPDCNQQEKAELLKVLRKTGGNQSETGRLLGVSRVTIRKRIKKHGIEVLREIRG